MAKFKKGKIGAYNISAKTAKMLLDNVVANSLQVGGTGKNASFFGSENPPTMNGNPSRAIAEPSKNSAKKQGGKPHVGLIFPGIPKPQERPFVTRHGTFDRPESKRVKMDIRSRAIAELLKNKWKISSGAIGAFIFFFNPRKNADIDNLGKLILDALSGVVWEDDKQIIFLVLKKMLDKTAEPCTIIDIYELGEVY